jgi:plastocyanin
MIAFAYLGTTEVNSSQISSLQEKLNNLQSQLNSDNASLSALRGQLNTLPVMHQKPTTRNIRVEWANSLNAHQDRFFLPTITVNQGDTIDLTFISNDTDAHTFTLESPYDFQINATVPGSLDYLRNETAFTTNATNNSPGVKVFGTPGNITGTGSFVATYPGIFEYFCVYHVALGMFGYLIVLPNAESPVFNGTFTTSSVGGQVSRVSIAAGAAGNSNSPGFTPSSIVVVLGVNNTVIWTNNDASPHTVTANDGSFSSGNLNPGDTFTFTFTDAGTYYYHCSYHSWMQGVVIVLT